MKNKEYEPIKTIYYKDERNDEFADDNIVAKEIDENYVYVDKRLRWRFLRFVSYRLIAMPIAFLYCKIALHGKFKNRAVLKKVKKQGCFVYGNHTQQIGDPFIPNIALCPKSVYVIVHPNNVSMPGLGKVTPYLGALPLPSNLKAMRNFRDAIHTRIKDGNFVVIYPEAHIWPYYTGIRPFPDDSFSYPIKYGAPVFCFTNTYQKRKHARAPRLVTYVDGPFYPNDALPLREKRQDLRDRVHACMTERSRLSDCVVIEYRRAPM